MKKLIFTLFGIGLFGFINAQIDGRLMQYPDVSNTHITFTYGDDIWITSKSGGQATRLSSPEGVENFPKFSPDGSLIAFTGNYHGNNDIYVIHTNGGIPKRLTYHGMTDRVLGWTQDGKSVLFASSRESGRQRFNQFYTISIDGGPPTKLPVPYGEFASFSPDGKTLAYTDKSRVFRNWKRYRGGTAPDILTFNLNTFETKNITNNIANDEVPMWIGQSIFYMSDNGPNKRNNLWQYDISSNRNRQLTNFEDYDITFPSHSNTDIIFEAGGKLHLYNITSSRLEEVKIQMVTDQESLIPRQKKVASYIQDATLSPDGKRMIIQARGELFNVPAVEGFAMNLTATPGVAERKPAWSPDGKKLAYWSDEKGEYQLTLKDLTNDSPAKTITKFKNGFNYSIYWSPDSKKVVYIDQSMDINYIDIESGKVQNADKGIGMLHGALNNFSVSWSPDSKWFVYSKTTGNPATSAIFICNSETNSVSQLTSGYYADNTATFSKDGKYIFFSTNRRFQPVYSDVDNTFIYPNTTGIAVGTVNNSIQSLLKVKNDEVSLKKEEEEGKEEEDTEEDKTINIQIGGFENRVEILDVQPGNLGNLAAVEGKLLFTRFPNSGSASEGQPSVDYYDIKKQEVKTIIKGVVNYEVSADGKKLGVSQGQKLAVIDIKPDQKISKTVPLDKLVMNVIPKEEWKQIFNDVWRMERDYFYDPGMHGVDWNTMKKRYGSLVEQASSRNDVNIIIGDLIAELDASHTYNGGGDITRAKRTNVGYLGADYALVNGAYRIKKIISGAPWDTEVRSPLSKPGINVKEGDYILQVNGIEIDASKSIFAAFQGLGNKTIQLTINSSPDLTDSRKIIVKPLTSETRLRHLAWIEKNRQTVDKATNGRVGYVYVRSTGVDGQNELIRQFYGQMHKDGLIIDERFNSGGQIPDRFIELLDRDPLAYWAIRDGGDFAFPPSGNFGPKVMLINGFSGSGGDAFPDYFRKRGLGPLIGTRTWGGLIGISGVPNLIDNGNVTVPTFRMFDPDGTWFKEGHGVDPDIEAVEDFQELANGNDAQLDAGIKEVLRLLNNPARFKVPKRPAYEKRN